VLAALLCAPSAQAQSVTPASASTLDLQAFIAKLDEIETIIDSSGPIRDVLVAMPSVIRVRHGDQRFEASLEPLAAYLASDPSQATYHLQVARRQVHAMREQAAALLNAPASLDGGSLQPRLRSILDRREYTRLRETSWWTALRQRIGDWLMSWFDRLGGDRLDTGALGTVLVWTVLTAVAVALVIVYRRTRTRPVQLASPDDGAFTTAARAWGLRALAAARSGNATEAVRAGYQAAIVQFSEHGLWRLDDARTAREYLDLLGPGEAMRPIFAEIAAQFEHVFYGHRSLTAADLARFVRDLETLGCVPAQQPSI
jgi:hypothetical protein